MLRRTLLLGSLAAVPLLAGCADESPTMGSDRFPAGTAPVTLEVAVPAGAFLEELGRFAGYTRPIDASFGIVANQFEGALNANTLIEFFAFPNAITYFRGDVSVVDSVFTYQAGQVVVTVDSLGTADTGPVSLQLYEIAQPWFGPSATWTTAVDTGGVTTNWQQPGGTRGALLGEAHLVTGALALGDSITFDLDSLAVARLAEGVSHGVLLRTDDPGTRVQVRAMTLRTAVRPIDADPDTIIEVTPQTRFTFVMTPDPPEPETQWHAGGIASARTLFRIDPELRVPGCPPPAACPDVPLSQVALHRATLRLVPVFTPDGFRPVDPVQLQVRAVTEPEFGRFAPLGPLVLEVQSVPVAHGDTAVHLPLTAYLLSMRARDDLPGTFALLGQPAPESPFAPRGFGVAWFRGDPELHLVYTLTGSALRP